MLNSIDSIRNDLFRNTKLPLYKYRNENDYLPVIGYGNQKASIVFIGEAPGKNEAKTGKPFCGRAGQILDELLGSVGIKREDVYITNIVKDRPPENRDPSPEEIKMYGPYLDRELEIIKPKVIATLGRYSMDYIMRKFGLEDKLEIISSAHGKLFKENPAWGKVNIIPLYHPAASIYNQKLKETLKSDFEILKKFAKTR